jgi:hypothetical protein
MEASSRLEEEMECIHLYLDDKDIPRQSEYGRDFSIVGRIQQLEATLLRKMSEIESAAIPSKN